MKITAITKYKHGGLYAALESLKWTQHELAVRSGIQDTVIGKIINLRIKPSEYYANKIQNALSEAGYYLDVLEQWPETFHGLESGFSLIQTADVELENLLNCKEAFMLPAPESEDTDKIDKELDDALSELPEDQKECIRLRFFEGNTLEGVGSKLHLTRERVRQIQNIGLAILRRKIKVDINKMGSKKFPNLIDRAQQHGLMS